MTEQEWLTTNNAHAALAFVRGQVSNRKLRLYAVACCRRVFAVHPREAHARRIAATEAFADGRIDRRKFQSAFPTGGERPRARPTFEAVAHMAVAALCWLDEEQPKWELREADREFVRARWAPGEYAEHYTSRVCLHAAHAMTLHDLAARDFAQVMDDQTAAQLRCFRDIVGNPFRPVAFDPGWRTATAVSLARPMYDGRDFAALPILADALQDAGCDEAGVLAHCRDAGPHVRGCWVVDGVLGLT